MTEFAMSPLNNSISSGPDPGIRLRRHLHGVQAGSGRVRGTSLSTDSGHPQSWELTQCHNGLTWMFDGEPPPVQGKTQELTQLAERKLIRNGVVFSFNPQVHHYPRSAPPMVPNRRVFSFLKRQAFKSSMRCLATPLKQVIDRLDSKSQQTRWQRAALDVPPDHI